MTQRLTFRGVLFLVVLSTCLTTQADLVLPSFFELPAQNRFFNPIMWFLENLYDLFYDDSGRVSSGPVSVVQGDALTMQERKYLHARALRMHDALQKMLDREVSLQSMPRIGLCCSGGGYRAMIASAGFYRALEEAGIIDVTTYAAASSGSSWMLAPWLARGGTVASYIGLLKKYVQRDFFMQDLHIKEFLQVLDDKDDAEKEIGFIDLCSGILADRLMEDLPGYGQQVYMSDVESNIRVGFYPYPLIATLLSNVEPYEMIEWNPYEMYCSYENGSIPIQGVGSTFCDGKSMTAVQEEIIAYFMTVSGSAYSLTLDDVLRLVKAGIDSSMVQKVLDYIISDDTITDLRFLPIKIPNPWHDLAQDKIKRKKCTLGDAGLLCNIPLHLLLRPERAVDLIIVCDASSDTEGYIELRRAADYAAQYGFPFPSLDDPVYDDGQMRVFSDATKPTAPVIIYFAIPEQNYSIFKFDYTAEEFDNLSGSMHDVVCAHVPKIKEIIGHMVDRSLS